MNCCKFSKFHQLLSLPSQVGHLIEVKACEHSKQQKRSMKDQDYTSSKIIGEHQQRIALSEMYE